MNFYQQQTRSGSSALDHCEPNGTLFSLARVWSESGRRCALATVILTSGSSPCQVGTQLLVDDTGAFEGSVSSGALEGKVVEAAADVIASQKSRLLSFAPVSDGMSKAGLCCASGVQIFLQPLPQRRDDDELVPLQAITDLFPLDTPLTLKTNIETGITKILSPREQHLALGTGAISLSEDSDGGAYYFHQLLPARRLIIVGAVHTAQYLAQLAQLSGFEASVIDPRPRHLASGRFSPVTSLYDAPLEILSKPGFLDETTAVVTLSHNPELDDLALIAALHARCFFIGALGSSRSHSYRCDRLRAQGVGQQELDRISGPVGLDIGAGNPQEIAISILSEIILSLRGHKRTCADAA
ncbi:XdhC family protein [uncultured Cohaesibacter sp.]|uniref:XdhC family protein n=1 Tax=uncultured Cohaesibacter sp. TaxID=1002546 RepID=UPI00292FD1D6|nr:XdhC family protein [uncultured Cohaesibacter sp.]